MNPPGDSARACRPSMSLRLQASIISRAFSSSNWSLLSVTSGCDRGDLEGSWLVFSSTISASPYARCSSSSAAISCWPSQRVLRDRSVPAFLQAMCLPQSQEATPVRSAYDDVSPRQNRTCSGQHRSDQCDEVKICTWAHVLRAGFSSSCASPPRDPRSLRCDVSARACRRVVEDATRSQRRSRQIRTSLVFWLYVLLKVSISHARYYRQG